MSLITLNTNRESHYLQYEGDKKPVLIEEPIGWKNNPNQGIKRSKDSNEFISKEAKDVRFIKKGRDYILNTEKIHGSQAKIRYIIVKENPEDSMDFYKDIYFLNLYKYKDKNGILSIKIDEGGLAKTLKAKESLKIEYDRDTDIHGNSIEKLSTRNLLLGGRKIFLRSLLKEENADFTVRDGSKHGGHYYLQTAIPVKVVTPSHEEVSDTYSDEHNQRRSSNPNVGLAGLCFFLIADRDKRLNIDLDLDFWLRRTNYRGNERYGRVRVNLVVYKDGTEFNLKERIELYNLENPHSVITKKIAYAGSHTLDLNKDDSVSLELLTDARMGSGFPAYGWGRWNWDITESNTIINISEDSEITPSQTKVVRIPELIDKEVEIITGKKGLFYSELFGRKDLGYEKDGEFAGLTITNGLWIRGFDSKDDKKPSISMKDTVSSLNATCAVGTMIERIGFKERYRVEGLDFFYIPQVTLELPNIVEDLEIVPAVDFIYGKYKFGYQKGGDGYEEATGIGEYNGQAEYSNVLTDIERELSVLSVVRGDPSMPEFTRRKHKSTHPQEDTRYDLDNVFIDAKEGDSDVMVERKYQDDFESAPTGIYDPDSATNLRFTPARMRDRRKLFLASSLFQYPDSYIRYMSSNCNSNLCSKANGEPILKENGDIQVKTYGKPRFQMYWATFTHIVSFETSKKLRSKIVINGKERYVFYGIVKFKVAANKYKYGYLFEVKENGKGQWKVLLANR